MKNFKGKDVLITVLFVLLPTCEVSATRSGCQIYENGRCPNDPASLFKRELITPITNSNSSSIKFIILRNVVKRDDDNSFDEAKLRSADLLNAEYSEYLSTVQKLEDSEESPLIYSPVQNYKPYDFQQFTEIWNTGLEVRKRWNDYLYRKFILPVIIQNFLGFLPIQVPGLPYHIDPGSPDEYGYKAINSILEI